MKTQTTVLADAARRLASTWHLAATGNLTGWPLRLPLGKPSRAELENSFTTVRGWAIQWRDWADKNGVTLDWETRMVHGTRQPLPTHLHLPDPDTTAVLVGGPWPRRLSRGRARTVTLAARFPHTWTSAHVRYADTLTDTDFGLLITAAAWFETHDATGWTPRQVPIAGLHGKWLNHHRPIVAALAGKDDLGLVSRPTRIHFTYVDPGHLGSGGRAHDSLTLGDTFRLPYEPSAIIITENKDTAVYFPALPGAVVIEGGGTAGSGLLPRVDWVRDCPRLIYWGDMDARGYEIVNTLRANGVPVQTVLMDLATFTSYAPYGAHSDDKGDPLPCQARKPLPMLSEAERAVYEQVTDPAFTGPRRVEQERIPLDVAVHAVSDALSMTTGAPPRS